MKIKLLSNTPLSVCVQAIRTCYNSFSKSDTDLSKLTDNLGENDRKLIYRVGNKLKHGSVLEHINYSWDIQGISRAVLQELARHRHSSFSVKSTRYTLSELKKETNIPLNLEKYVCIEQIANEIKPSVIEILKRIRYALDKEKYTNDQIKPLLPEGYKTSLIWTINCRSLQNFLKLRTDIPAYEPIRKLAYEIFDNLPEQHKYLFEDSAM